MEAKRALEILMEEINELKYNGTMTDELEEAFEVAINTIKGGYNMNEREYIIERAKALGITTEELGIEPRVKLQTIKDEQFIRETKNLIDGEEIDAETARTYFSEEYYEQLGIAEKKYKIVKCKMAKTIYKDIYVAIPEDEEEDYYAERCVGDTSNLNNDYPDDEEDWEIGDVEVEEEDLTESEVNRRGQDEIWNYNDFAE